MSLSKGADVDDADGGVDGGRGVALFVDAEDGGNRGGRDRLALGKLCKLTLLLTRRIFDRGETVVVDSRKLGVIGREGWRREARAS